MGGIVVVHCSEVGLAPDIERLDARHFEGTIEERVAVPGGPLALARLARTQGLAGRLASKAGAGSKLVRELVDGLRPREFALVTHEGCRWYRGEADPAATIRRQGDDLIAASKLLRGWLPREVIVSGYVLRADATDDGELARRIL